MPDTTTPRPESVLDHVRRLYAFQTVEDTGHAPGGTAGRTWLIHADGRRYFVRQRGVRSSSPERIAFDHGLRRHLVQHGVPTAAPLTHREGQTYFCLADRVYEVYPYLDGRPFRFDAEADLRAAAMALAQFHEVSRRYAPDLPYPRVIAQYAWLGLHPGTADHMDNAVLQRENITRLPCLATGELDAHTRDTLAWAVDRVSRRVELQASPAYQRLTDWTVHGDYTPANVWMRPDGEEGVAGIFDLDWAMPGMSRMRDVADALYFFAGDRRTMAQRDIWSLTAGVGFDMDRCLAFLRAYQEVSPISAEELALIPAAFEGRWFSIWLEGIGKVAEADRLRFFVRDDLRTPVQWLNAHWPAVMAKLGR